MISGDNPNGEMVVYVGDDCKPQINVRFQGETIWLTQAQLANLFDTSRPNITMHIKNIFDEGELNEASVCKDFLLTAADGKKYTTKHYNLDLIISLGYRVKSNIATNFRIWATERLREYITKGFVMDDERLKENSGGNYWKELLERIRDIRSSEKILYRQVLDLFATSQDYNPSSKEQIEFFQIVQNKLHYAVNMLTAAEVIYSRVDSDKPFLGLTTFRGQQPTKSEAQIAKNYLMADELGILNRLVSAFFDLAELKAINHEPMRMADWVREVDKFAATYGKGVLDNPGKISHKTMLTKVAKEYESYKERMRNQELSSIEQQYLEELRAVQKRVEGKR
ncbi:cell filamentation protein Fic [Candidatus Saccharibacteria bacterium oral taxon 488]|nr:cell filamentation protein Fic [Candidatus Saccharibacteria bacterium oral taxon 488]